MAKLLEHPHCFLLADGFADIGQASSRLSPWEWQPGRSRQLTDQPSSVCSKRIPVDTLGSSTCLWCRSAASRRVAVHRLEPTRRV